MKRPLTPPRIEILLKTHGAKMARVFSDLKYSDFLREAQEKYWHWDRVRIVARQRHLEPELAWLVIRLSRSTKPLSLRAFGENPVSYAVNDTVQRELMLIDQQLAGRLRTDDQSPLSEAQRDRYIINSLMEEAIASSLLEGASTTHRVAKEMLRQGRRPRTSGERMVLNNYMAMRIARERCTEPLTPEIILDIQRTLTEGVLDPEDVGRLRRPQENVVVDDQYGTILHEPPPADELPSRLERLCAFANETDTTSASFLHPVVRAIALHFQIGFDHPFCDGNGRTARAIFYWSMLRSNYRAVEFTPISRIILSGPSRYGRAYLETETDGFDLTYFILYHLDVLRRAREELSRYIARKRQQMAEARTLLRQDPGLNERQHALLMHATRTPDAVYTIESHQRSHGVAYATARADLLVLAEKGYLDKLKRGKHFEFIAGERMAHQRP